VLSRFSVCPTAITSAIGAMISTSIGISRLVIPRNVRTVWRWPVIRSISRRACVNQITVVRLTRTRRNAPKVVRKM